MRRFTTLFVLTLAAIGTPALAEPTDVTVRVISQDAKFVGTSMGGVRITLTDAHTGEPMIVGMTEGGTGDTGKIMNAQGRSPMVADDSAASFTTTLDIDTPRLVTLEAYGPMGHPESAIRVTQQRWIMPGEDVTAGGGWVVELPGLVITPTIAIDGANAMIEAKVAPMCGCPITPGGLWPAEEYEVTASLWQEGAKYAESPLAFTAAPGLYSGSITLPAQGRYSLLLHARNTRTGNSGLRELKVASD